MAKKYFVTGATGAIGSALIPLLLEDQNSQVWALMRADSCEHLAKRLEELITFWEMDHEQAQDARRRIIPLLGDTDQSKFALSEDIYAEIANQCTHIIHCAGVVRMNLPLEVARKHALGSVKNIGELALSCQASGLLQKIEYVSTVGVAGRMPGIVPETWIIQPREFHNTYEQAKAEAEDYLREQIEQHNLPVTVHRPSMVVGDSKTGKIIHYQIFYHICEFLAGRRTFGILPRLGHGELDTIPVDYLAGIIEWSSGRQDSIGKIFHLCSGPGNAIKLTQLQKKVRKNMRVHRLKLPTIISLPFELFNLIIKMIAPFLDDKGLRAVKAFPFFLDYLGDDRGFRNQETINLLEKSLGPKLPVNDSYIDSILEQYMRSIIR
jgi:thioester reductase-like protein